MTARYSDREGTTWPNTSQESAASKTGYPEGKGSVGPGVGGFPGAGASFIYQLPKSREHKPNVLNLTTPFRNNEIINKSIEFQKSHQQSGGSRWVDIFNEPAGAQTSRDAMLHSVTEADKSD